MMKPSRKFRVQRRVPIIEGLAEYWMTIDNEYEILENESHVISLRIKHYSYDGDLHHYIWRLHHFNYFFDWQDESGNYRLKMEESNVR